jgi:hypothetical protein
VEGNPPLRVAVHAPAIALAEVRGAEAGLRLGEEVRSATDGVAASFGTIPSAAGQSGATAMKVSK